VVLRTAVGLMALLLAVQLFYPGDKLLPFARVEGVAVSGWKKTDAAELLNKRSAEQRINVALGKATDSYDTPKPTDIGLKVTHDSQVKAASYPWYMRLIPTSIVWFGLVQTERPPTYVFDDAAARDYLTTKIGKGCVIPAKDATLRLETESLKVVAAKSGGTCQEDEAVASLGKLQPRLGQTAKVTIPVTVIAPNVGDDEAKALADKLN
jgi:hypothetical protein